MHYDSLVTQLVDPPWSVRIAEKVRMGLPYPCVVLISASGQPESYPAERSEVWDHPSVANMFYEELGSRDPRWN